MKFDDVIAELGEFGPHQKRIYLLVCLATIPSGLQTLLGVFTMAIPDHRCALPDLANDTFQSQGQWHEDLVSSAIPMSKDGESYSRCDLYKKDGGSNLYTNQTVACDRWVYSKDPFESTFVSQTDMVCDDKMLRTYSNMILMAGKLAGSLTLGILSDVIGRRKVLIIGAVGGFCSALAVGFVSTYEPFVVLRFFIMFFDTGLFLAAYVIGMEIVGPSKRKYAGIVVEMFWCVGLFLQTGLSYLLRDWRHLQLAASAPIIIVVVVLFFFLPESPRWLVSEGKFEEAKKIVTKIADGNKVVLSEKAMHLENVELEGKGEKIWHMFTTPVLLIRCLVIFFNWFVASKVYYGLSLNVGALSGNIYLNFFLSTLVELLSYVCCILLLDVLGRKLLQCFTMILGGAACICTLFPVIYAGSDMAWLTVVLSLVGKFGASAAFAVIYVFSAELFPTVMRNSGMGLSSFAARIGGILAPYIADLGELIDGDLGVALPLIIFGALSVLAGLLALLLPETLNRKLPDTLEDARHFGKAQNRLHVLVSFKKAGSSAIIMLSDVIQSPTKSN